MTADLHGEEGNKNIGLAVAVGLHALLLLLGFMSVFSHIYPVPQPKGGISIAFGDITETGADVNPDAQNEQLEIDPVESAKSKPAASEPVTTKEVKVLDKKSTIPVAKSNNSPKTNSSQQAAKPTNQTSKPAEDPRTKVDESKKRFSDILGKGTGKSSGSNNQGDPNGDPNSGALESISKGKGAVGDGLDRRSAVYMPTISDNSQKSGRVVIEICIDQSGKVIKSKFTQRGSTTTDSDLVRLAEKGALKYKFSPSDVEEQCGTIKIDFVVQ